MQKEVIIMLQGITLHVIGSLESNLSLVFVTVLKS